MAVMSDPRCTIPIEVLHQDQEVTVSDTHRPQHFELSLTVMDLYREYQEQFELGFVLNALDPLHYIRHRLPSCIFHCTQYQFVIFLKLLR